MPFGQAVQITFSKSSFNEKQHLNKAYTSWQTSLTKYFSISGLNISLPIEYAWCKIYLIHKDTVENFKSTNKKIITKYYEWDRLAYDSSNKESVEADILPDLSNHCVVVGGPGSGKSTLLKRISNYYSAKNKVVILIRLPMILLKMLKQGIGIEEAICKYLSDCTPFSEDNIRLILKEQFVFLADGLDECGAQRSFIVAELKKWAELNKNKSIVLTTRPVGYDPSYFTGWSHFEISPLNKDDIKKFIGEIKKYYLERNQQDVANSLEKIDDKLDENKVYNISSRNPLLLGFILTLIINKSEHGNNRSSLYKNIVLSIHKSPYEDRIIETNYDSTTLISILEIIAFVMKKNDSFIVEKIVENAANIVSVLHGSSKLQAKKDVEHTLNYWEKKGILEKISSGIDELILFIHMGFNEYCASQYINTFDDDYLTKFLTKIKSEPNWREIILLAGISDESKRIVNYYEITVSYLHRTNKTCKTKPFVI